MTAFQKEKNKAVEAGLKYFILGSFSSALFLLGICLIYGLMGTVNLYHLFLLLSFYSFNINFFLIIGFVLIFIGLFFKLSIAPFHIWLPDVFDGSSKFIVSIFSLLPKMSLFFLLYKIYILIFLKVMYDWFAFFTFFIIITWVIGVLGAIYTNKINKLLAYSSINHMGFFLFSILLNNIYIFILYLLIYSFILLNIFSIIFVLYKNNNYKVLNYLNQLIYLKKTNFFLCLSLAISFFSLAGIPPLSGFFGKFFIFLFALNSNFFILVLCGLFISIISCFYYLRIIKFLYFNNTKIWLFLPNINRTTSYLISFSFIFNLLFIVLLPFFFEFVKFLNFYF
jgi:NADH-quinone oxidoreductase subunit N